MRSSSSHLSLSLCPPLSPSSHAVSPPWQPTRSSRPVRSPRARSAKLSEWEGMTRDADLKYDDLRVAKTPEELACILAAMRSDTPLSLFSSSRA